MFGLDPIVSTVYGVVTTTYCRALVRHSIVADYPDELIRHNPMHLQLIAQRLLPDHLENLSYNSCIPPFSHM
jgi:hypothetical protein